MNKQFSHPTLHVYPKHPVFPIKSLEQKLLEISNSQEIVYVGEKNLEEGRTTLGTDFYKINKDLDIAYFLFKDKIPQSPIIMGVSEKYWKNQKKHIPQGLQFYSIDSKGRVSVPLDATKQILKTTLTIHLYRGENLFFIVPHEQFDNFPLRQPSLDYYI
ncbi:MAG: hypothetical protein LAT82_02970 [Nanoarchaeota archaeon]|nr:hypothetical protein [Nanoarchaeota archaeon]